MKRYIIYTLAKLRKHREFFRRFLAFSTLFTTGFLQFYPYRRYQKLWVVLMRLNYRYCLVKKTALFYSQYVWHLHARTVVKVIYSKFRIS